MRRLLLALIPAAALLQPAKAQPPMHLTLADAERLAAQNNPRYNAARLNAAAAHQEPSIYRAAELPELSGAITGVGADNGSRLAAGALNNPAVYSRMATGVIASQLITDFGRVHDLVRMSNLQAQAQDQNSEATRADVVLEAARAYFDVLRSQAVLKVANQTVDQRQVVANQTAALARSQLRSQVDVTFAEVNLSDAKLLQVEAQNGVSSANAELADVLALPGGTMFDLAEEPIPAALSAQPDPLIAQAMQQRPDLKTLQLQQSAAERFARAEHELYYPTVSALAAAGLVPAGEPEISGRYGAVGVNVSIPVFNGGLFKARQSEAQIKAQAAAQSVTELANRIARDVRVAWLGASAAQQRLGLTQQLVAQAQQSLDLATSRYNLGLGSIVELSQAQLNLTGAQIASASALYDYQAQRVVVDYQTGTLR